MNRPPIIVEEFIFLRLNSLVGITPFLDGLILFFAKYLIYVMVAGALGIGLFRSAFSGTRNDGLAAMRLAVVSALTARFGVTELIQFFYSRPRPFEIVEGARKLLEHAGGGSFPSGHAAFAFALAAAISAYYPRLGIIFWLSATLIALGRVSAGVHWPGDILGGAAVGIGTTWLLSQLMNKFKGRT